MGDPLRVRQLPREGLAQRQSDRPQRGRLPAVRAAPPDRLPQARRRQPPRDPHRQPPLRTDFPPAKFDARGRPLGGWWNYGGILREVYLRRIDDIDFNTVDVRPDAALLDLRRDGLVDGYACATRAARSARPSIGRFGARKVKLGTVSIGPKKFATLQAHAAGRESASLAAGSPVPLRRVAARYEHGTKTKREPQAYTRRVGIRSVRASTAACSSTAARSTCAESAFRRTPASTASRSTMRDRDLQLGVGPRARRDADPRALPAASVHARARRRARAARPGRRSPSTRSTRSSSRRRRSATPRARARGQRDRQPQSPLDPAVVDRQRAQCEPRADPGLLHRARERRAKALDPSRPVALAFAASPTVGCQKEYGPLDVLGVNDYFGWYPGPTVDRRSRAAVAPTSTRCAPATRRRR